ncbi:MAG: hypothetical protein RLN87_13855 [Parasphingopyxis sp.]|uniref:hypothetical protein n=1 Tax=Parasphingopyxis sp. TaxID=1920299 RepID=UPI0032EABF55
MKSQGTGWPALAVESWMLGAEMGMVIWLRTLRMMTGGAIAEREAERMVSEKMTAGMMFWPAMMAGGCGQSGEEMTRRALAHYGRPVRANRRRLSRG